MTEFKVSDLCNDQEMVTLREDMTVEEGLRTLSEAHVLAAPVCDTDGKWVGLIDHLDLVFWALEVSTEPLELTKKTDKKAGLDIMDAMRDRMTKFSLSHVGDGIADKSRVNPYVEIQSSAPLDEALEKFYDGTRRLVVVDEEGQPIHLLTQTRVAQHFAAYPERMGPVGNQNLGELGLVNPVVHVDKEDRVLDAFHILASHRVSGLPVLSDDNLWSCLSSTDNMRVQGLRYERLLETVEDFLTEGGMPAFNPVNCAPSSTLGSALALMNVNRVHRVFIRTHDGPLCGILSISDVVRLVAASKNAPASKTASK